MHSLQHIWPKPLPVALLSTLICLCLTGVSRAGVLLQLDILGGTYDTVNEDVFTGNQSFTLRAYYDYSHPQADITKAFISVALTPQTSTPSNIGSFSFNGETVEVTKDMKWAAPPVDTGDLPSHGIYDTYFKEFEFTFAGAGIRNTVNVQDAAGTPDTIGFSPSTGKNGDKGLKYVNFDITVNLPTNFGLHFDLYTINSKSEIDKFAPFSHDAQYGFLPTAIVLNSMPEPSAAAVWLGLLSVIGFRRRNRDTA
jgi:hypothetical protein